MYIYIKLRGALPLLLAAILSMVLSAQVMDNKDKISWEHQRLFDLVK